MKLCHYSVIILFLLIPKPNKLSSTEFVSVILKITLFT